MSDHQTTTPTEARNRRTAARLAKNHAVESDDLELLRNTLAAYSRSKVATLPSPHDYLDVVDTALENFLRASRTGRVRAPTALAYLRAIVRNASLDAAAAKHAVPIDTSHAPEQATGGDDEAIARFLDAHATTAIVEELLAEIAAQGDHIATRVVNAYLTLAEDLGAAPTYRLVGRRAGLSHTTVHNVLKRLQQQIGQEFP